MIRTIGSLVQEPSNRKIWLLATVLYTIACMSTSSFLGAFLSGIGLLMRNFIGVYLISYKNIEYLLVGTLAIAYALSDIGLLSLPRPRLMNAVPVTWWRWWRPYGGALAYGAALGLGVTTQIHFGAFYILWIWCVFKGNILYGAMLMGLYGAARSLVLFPASRYIFGSCSNPEKPLSWLTMSLETAKVTVAVILIMFGVYITVSSIL